MNLPVMNGVLTAVMNIPTLSEEEEISYIYIIYSSIEVVENVQNRILTVHDNL